MEYLNLHLPVALLLIILWTDLLKYYYVIGIMTTLVPPPEQTVGHKGREALLNKDTRGL